MNSTPHVHREEELHDAVKDPSGTVDPGPVVGHLLANAGMGGAEIYVSLLANEQAARGRGSRIIVLSEPGPVSERFSADVKIEYLDYRRESIRNPRRFLKSVVRGYREISGAVGRMGVDVLQTHLPDTNLWGLALSLTGRCKVVITIHNNRFLRGTETPSFTSFVKKKAYRMMFRRCAAIVCVSREVRRSLLSTLGVQESEARSVVVVDNGVPIPEPLAAPAREALRSRFGVGKGETWIVAAGRLTEAKNFSCLVRAAARLRDASLPCKVLIAGEGELRADLAREIEALKLQDVVMLPGNIQNLGDVLRAADLLAMPSRWEGLPMVLLEALARGLPVVGTRINGLVDIIEDGRHGFLVDVDNDDQLAAKIADLMGDRERLQAMSGAAIELARSEYDFRRVYDDLHRVYVAAWTG